MTIRRVGAEAAPLLAALHAEAFPPAERWGAEAIGLLLGLPGHVALLDAPGDAPRGFVMGRVAAGEAEVLTLATRPEARRVGVGRALMQALLCHAARQGAAALFLEVAESNQAARGLYAGLGGTEVGRRRHYYPDGGDALVFSLPVSRPDATEGG